MKILHISDLHLGKKMSEFNLIDDQRYVLNQAVDYVRNNDVDCVFLCGDIYDTSNASNEATKLYSDFLTALVNLKTKIFVISGNHDSREKLGFASEILKSNDLYISTKVSDALNYKEFGNIRIYMMPFLRYYDVNANFNKEFESNSDAIRFLVSEMKLDKSKTNILLAHQTVFPDDEKLEVDGSESIPSADGKAVGDIATIPCEIFKDFDYAALGHIHKPLNISKNARYSGSILKYNKKESETQKSFTLVEISEKKLSFTPILINFLHDVVVLEGYFKDLMQEKLHHNDYVYFRLLDENPIENVMEKLRTEYPYAAAIEYKKSSHVIGEIGGVEIENQSYKEIFEMFYEKMYGNELSDYQKEIVEKLLKDGEKDEAN